MSVTELAKQFNDEEGTGIYTKMNHYHFSFAVEDGVTDEAEIKWAVKRLQNNHAGGASRMTAEYHKGWLAAARREEKKGETAEKRGESGKTHERE